jgi:hypothetical protein
MNDLVVDCRAEGKEERMRGFSLRAGFILTATWIVGAGSAAHAQPIPQNSPLTLYFTVNQDPTPGLFDYTFRLVLDNHTGSFQPGQGFGGIVFGDVNFGNSPLSDFVLNPGGNLGPFSTLTQSGDDGTGTSYHNGPTLGPVLSPIFLPIYWFPSGIGDQLTFSGVSHSDVTSLTFSTYLTSGLTTVGANFQPATLVPEPFSITLCLAPLVAGVATAAGSRYRKRYAPEYESG